MLASSAAYAAAMAARSTWRWRGPPSRSRWRRARSSAPAWPGRRWAPSSCRASTRASSASTSSGCRRSRSPRHSVSASRSKTVLARFPEVRSIVTRTGRAEVATDPVGPDETEVMVKLRPKEEWTTAHDLDELGEKIKQAVEPEVPATFVAVSQPIEDRVNQLLGRLARRRRGQGVRHRSGAAQGHRRRDRTRHRRACPGAAICACSACSACRCSRCGPIGCAWPATASPPRRCCR